MDACRNGTLMARSQRFESTGQNEPPSLRWLARSRSEVLLAGDGDGGSPVTFDGTTPARAERPPQAASHVVLHAALPDAEGPRGTDVSLAGVQAQHHFTEGYPVLAGCRRSRRPSCGRAASSTSRRGGNGGDGDTRPGSPGPIPPVGTKWMPTNGAASALSTLEPPEVRVESTDVVYET